MCERIEDEFHFVLVFSKLEHEQNLIIVSHKRILQSKSF